MTTLRRTMVFIDGSAFRDTIRRFWYREFGSRPELSQDFYALGRLLCAPNQEPIRVNYYTGRPVAVEAIPAEGDDAARYTMSGIDLRGHEAHRAQRVLESHEKLERHINRCRYTRLATGRVVAHRRQHRYGPAFQWAANYLAAANGGAPTEADAALFERATKSNRESKQLRLDLVARLEELNETASVGPELMARYGDYITTLRDESIRFKEKGVDTLLTVEVMELCIRDAFDDAILFAADEDYVPLVEAVKRDGRRVIHAFLDVPSPGRRLREACDDWRTISVGDLKATTTRSATDSSVT